MISRIPDGYHLVKVDNKTWIQTKDPSTVKPIVRTSGDINEGINMHHETRNDGITVIHEGKMYKRMKDLAEFLGISQQRLSHSVREGKIKVKKIHKR
jgi:hypothetical protein